MSRSVARRPHDVAPCVRVLADDLTGALDSADGFSSAGAGICVVWPQRGVAAPAQADDSGSLAIDCGTREATAADALAAVRALAPLLLPAQIALCKVDSLMRGHPMAQLAACLHAARAAGRPWDAVVVAPAFPHEQRITRDGVQYARDAEGHWVARADLRALLAAHGLAARVVDAAALPALLQASTPADPLLIVDARHDDELDRIAGAGPGATGRVLWCGSAGLGHALARASVGTPSCIADGPVLPVLGLFGTDHPVTRAQRQASGAPTVRIGPERTDGAAADVAGPGHDGGADDDAVIARLRSMPVAFVEFPMPHGTARADAAAQIGQRLAWLLPRLNAPGTLVVSGGETLRAVCALLGATALRVVGRIEPGVPCALLEGGRWHGTPVVSKSGAFGRPTLWRDWLQRAAPGPVPRAPSSVIHPPSAETSP